MRSATTRWLAVVLVAGSGLAGCAEEVPEAPEEGAPTASPDPSAAPADPLTRVQQSLAYVQVDPAGSGGTSGSVGVLLTAEGQVLVFSPPLTEATDAVVTVTPAEADPVEGTVVGGDPRTGLVVVTVEPAAGLVPAVLGDSDAVEIGDDVTLLSLGPEGDIQLSTGEVTTTGEVVAGSGTAMIGFTVDDDLIAGGPVVVNGAGEVVGIATLSTTGAEGQTITGFAIPSHAVDRIADQLIGSGEVVHPYLGVSVDDAPDGGALVQQVGAGSPAEQAGLRTGDVIVQVGDRTVEDAADVVLEVQARQVGDQLAVTYTRDGAEVETTVTLAAAPAGE